MKLDNVLQMWNNCESLKMITYSDKIECNCNFQQKLKYNSSFQSLSGMKRPMKLENKNIWILTNEAEENHVNRLQIHYCKYTPIYIPVRWSPN